MSLEIKLIITRDHFHGRKAGQMHRPLICVFSAARTPIPPGANYRDLYP